MPCMHKNSPCVYKNRPCVHKNRPCLCENNLYRRETGLTGKYALHAQNSHCRRKAAIADEEIILPGAEEGPD